MQGVFVTATDTGVGKTHVGQWLVRALRDRGVSLRVRKPVESGCSTAAHGGLSPADAIVLQQAAGAGEDLQQVCPHRFADAVSPALAARIAGTPVTLRALTDACLSGLRENDFLWVEGAGGYYSPIADDGLNADLADRLGLPLLIVAPDRLGCVGQTLLALEAAARRGRPVLGVVLNSISDAEPPPPLDNRTEIGRHSGVRIWRFPHTGGTVGAATEVARAIAATMAVTTG